MRRNLFWLSDEQWRRIGPHLPKDVRARVARFPFQKICEQTQMRKHSRP
jgi:hypothetical protein